MRQPEVANTYEPDLASRQSAPAAVRPLLNAFPIPNGPELGNGTAGFTASYSDPSSLDSSERPHRLSSLVQGSLFSDATAMLLRPSTNAARARSSPSTATLWNTNYGTQTVTVGSNQTITPALINEIRFNYSRTQAQVSGVLDNFGGAVPPSESELFPAGSPPDSSFYFFGDFNPYGLKFETGNFGNNVQQQINVTDNLSHTVGAHQIKAGVDYRRLNPTSTIEPYAIEYAFSSLANVIANTIPAAYVLSRTPDVQLLFSNWSLFAQDTWKATRKLTITYGLRWEYNSAPTSPNGTLPFTAIGLNDLATATIAPQGTPLWKATKDNFAPRLGIAWQPLPNWVLRAGAGIFYDLGYSDIADASSAWPYAQDRIVASASFPLTGANAAPIPFSTTPPASYFAVVDPNHVLPRTYEWNAAVERSFGKADVATITYVAAEGRKLMRQDLYNSPNPNFSGEFDYMHNGASSDYNALQAQYRHRFSYGLQTLLSYTWGHSIDDVSSDAFFLSVPPGASPYSNRGSSDFDIRQTFSGAVSYNIPAPGPGIWKAAFGGWSADSIITARTAPPVNVVTGQEVFSSFLSGDYSVQRPNLVSGVPVWISDSNAPGGREINAAAFSIPGSNDQGDLGRNTIRGFGATQVDFALRRQFRLHERLTLQARGEIFNIFNHPNFGPPINYLSSPQFGQATQTLASALGTGGDYGGLNPLYQIGGPRSAQLALKLLF